MKFKFLTKKLPIGNSKVANWQPFEQFQFWLHKSKKSQFNIIWKYLIHCFKSSNQPQEKPFRKKWNKGQLNYDDKVLHLPFCVRFLMKRKCVLLWIYRLLFYERFVETIGYLVDSGFHPFQEMSYYMLDKQTILKICLKVFWLFVVYIRYHILKTLI